MNTDFQDTVRPFFSHPASDCVWRPADCQPGTKRLYPTDSAGNSAASVGVESAFNSQWATGTARCRESIGQFRISVSECCDCLVQVIFCVGSRNLGADSCLAFGHHREEKADRINSALQ